MVRKAVRDLRRALQLDSPRSRAVRHLRGPWIQAGPPESGRIRMQIIVATLREESRFPSRNSNLFGAVSLSEIGVVVKTDILVPLTCLEDHDLGRHKQIVRF